MTLREKAIVTAYTGITMCVGDELGAFYDYVRSLGFEGLTTLNFASRELWDEIRARSKADFIEICKRTDPSAGFDKGVNIMENQKVYFTVNELMRYLNCSMATAYRLVHSKGFPTTRIGRKILVHVEGLKKWIEAHSGGGFCE